MKEHADKKQSSEWRGRHFRLLSIFVQHFNSDRSHSISMNISILTSQKTLSFLVTGDNNRVFWCVGWKMWAKRLKDWKSERKRERIKHILLNLISSASTLYMYAHVWESHTKRKREIVWLSRLPFIKKKYFFSL